MKGSGKPKRLARIAVGADAGLAASFAGAAKAAQRLGAALPDAIAELRKAPIHRSGKSGKPARRNDSARRAEAIKALQDEPLETMTNWQATRFFRALRASERSNGRPMPRAARIVLAAEWAGKPRRMPA